MGQPGRWSWGVFAYTTNILGDALLSRLGQGRFFPTWDLSLHGTIMDPFCAGPPGSTMLSGVGLATEITCFDSFFKIHRITFMGVSHFLPEVCPCLCQRHAKYQE